MLAACKATSVADKRFSGALGDDHPYAADFAAASAFNRQRGSADSSSQVAGQNAEVPSITPKRKERPP